MRAYRSSEVVGWKREGGQRTGRMVRTVPGPRRFINTYPNRVDPTRVSCQSVVTLYLNNNSALRACALGERVN